MSTAIGRVLESLLLVMVCLAGPLKYVEAEQVVIPFDFESKFDDGRYGKIIGDQVWKKLERLGSFVIPESMLDVRETCERIGFHPGASTSLEDMKRVVRDEFGGDIAIWGKVERPAGVRYETYDLWIYVVDFSQDPPRKIYEVKARTKTVSEIPHVYVKTALEHLAGKRDHAEPMDDAEIARRWRDNPNLVQGDFQQGTRAPRGWDPLPKHVTWVAADGYGTTPRNRLIRFVIPPDVAATTGVLYYSDYFPIEAGATYRLECHWRTTGTAAKIFVKCYDELPTRFVEGNDSHRERREVYRSQQNLKGTPGEWHRHTADFTPKHTQYTPRFARVMLYAYYPAGTVEWDDVVVKLIRPAPDGPPKAKRPSLETKVRTDEIKK